MKVKTATVRDLRTHFPKLEAWLSGGEEIIVTKHGKPVAWLRPAYKYKQKKFKMPDFMAQLKETWGDIVYSAEETAAMRRASQGES